jgi:hypothetical protein
MTHTDLKNQLIAQVQKFGVEYVARRLEIKPSYLRMILRGQYNVSKSIAKRMGYRKVVTVSFERIA